MWVIRMLHFAVFLSERFSRCSVGTELLVIIASTFDICTAFSIFDAFIKYLSFGHPDVYLMAYKNYAIDHALEKLWFINSIMFLRAPSL